MKSSHIRTILSAIWLVFTISLVGWWFVFVLNHLSTSDLTDSARRYRMLFLEGSTLIVTVLLGGVVLIILSYKDDQRHEKLKFFFSNFSHDIKTSIARLRLQGDILAEENDMKNNRTLQRLLSDISRLDLQLENSLLLSHVDDSSFMSEKINFSQLVQSIQPEFEDLKIQLKNNVQVLADSRALKSVIRNLFENSRRHGKATEISIQINELTSDKVKILIQDNGSGSFRSTQLLGKQILPAAENQGNGIGLYLTTRLVQKMKGSIQFYSEKAEGFRTELILKGQLI